MTEQALRKAFDHLVADEPPLAVPLETVVAKGRRRRVRRRVLRATGVLGLGAVVALGVTVPMALAYNHESPPTRHAPWMTPFALTGSRAAAASSGQLTPRQRRVANAIRSASPKGWTFQLGTDRWSRSAEGSLAVEATADDGSAPGRLLLVIAPPGDSEGPHACADPSFRQGGTCTERTLADGAVLALRRLVDFGGVKYVDVALTHPDGAGVLAESDNTVFSPWPPPRQLHSPAQKRHLWHVSRRAPTYTVHQLANVVIAVDRAVHD